MTNTQENLLNNYYKPKTINFVWIQNNILKSIPFLYKNNQLKHVKKKKKKEPLKIIAK